MMLRKLTTSLMAAGLVLSAGLSEGAKLSTKTYSSVRAAALAGAADRFNRNSKVRAMQLGIFDKKRVTVMQKTATSANGQNFGMLVGTRLKASNYSATPLFSTEMRVKRVAKGQYKFYRGAKTTVAKNGEGVKQSAYPSSSGSFEH